VSDFLDFCAKYKDEPACIQALVDLKWPAGFTCGKCQGSKAYHLTTRPRVFECATCGHQHSITAGTVFHKTRTDLRKWFIAAFFIGHDKRGISALMLSRELAMRYDTAWLMCHKLRHALTESLADFKLADVVEIGAAFYGGRRRTGNPELMQYGARTTILCAVEKVSTKSTDRNTDKQSFVAGSARIAVLPHTAAGHIDGFIGANIKPGTAIVLDAIRRHTNPPEPVLDFTMQSAEKAEGSATPIVRRILSNVRTWLNGTYHGVSVKHLPRYLREWNYRFNRRSRIAELDLFLLRRAISLETITYAGLVAGDMMQGAS
jgi:hypothetical protein